MTSPITLSGFTTNGAILDTATIAPFGAVTVSDSIPYDQVSATISFAGANGTLSGAGLSAGVVSGGTATYFLSATTAAALQAELRALTFTPTQGVDGATVTTAFDLTVSDVTASPPTAPSAVLRPGGNPVSVATDAAGDVFVPNTGNNTIMEYSPAGVLLRVLSGGIGRIDEPQSVATDAAGDVFVASTGNSTVEEFSPAGVLLRVLSGGIDEPQSVATDAAGDVFVASTGNSTVEEFSPAGALVQPPLSSGISSPISVATDAAGDVFVANSGNSTVEEFSPAGALVQTLSSGISDPASVATDAAGDVFVANLGSNTVEEFSPAGALVQPPLSSGLSEPDGVATDAAGDVFVANFGNSTVEEFSAAGALLRTLSSGIAWPRSVATDAAGDVFVANYMNGTVEEFAPIGVTTVSDNTTTVNVSNPDTTTLTVTTAASALYTGPAVTLSPSLSIGDTSTGSWASEASVPSGTYLEAADLVDGEVYVFDGYSGGYSSALSIYNPSTNSWATGGTTDIVARDELASAADSSGNIYLIGGISSNGVTAVVTAYNPSNGAITAKADLLTPAAGSGAAFGSDGQLYVVGGIGQGGNYLSSAEVYNPGANAFTAVSSLPSATAFETVVAFGSKIYAFGGQNESGSVGTVEIFDLSSGTWSLGAAMPVAVYGATGGVVNGKIVIAGGYNSGSGEQSTTQIYDPGTNSWTLGPSMPAANYDAGNGLISDGNQMFVVGGDANQSAAFRYSAPTLAGATVAISGGTFAGDGDVLAANTTGTPITASYDAPTETLSLSGTGTVAQYQQVLDSVTFGSTSANPDNSGANPTRTVTWTVSDGIASSAPASTTVNIAVTPTVAVTVDSTDVNLAANTATVTFTFSEAPTDFSLSDMTATGGALSNLNGSGTIYTATYTAIPNIDITNATVSVTPGSYHDGVGTAGTGGSTGPFTVDTVRPTTPTISDASVVNGYVNAANDTPSQVLTGTADAGDKVNVYLNGAVTPAFTTAADASGNWSVTVGALADGSYSYAATATDVAGNTASSAPLAFTVDTTTTESPISDSAVTTGTDGKSYINQANFNGGVTTLTGAAEAGDTVKVIVNGGAGQAATVASDGTWSLTLNGLTDGTAYSAVATATDVAGNTASSAPLAFTVDTTTTESPIADFGAVTTGTDGKSYLNAANFNGGTIFLTGQMEPGDIATLSADFNGSPNFVPVPAMGTVQGTWQASLTGLVDGESVSVVATASDVAGNTASSAPLTFTVDTTTSESAIADSAVTIGRDGKSYINGANFNGGVTTLTGTAEAGDTVSVSVNGGTAEAATMAAGGAWSLTLNGLTDGTAYSAVATATDPAGNTASSDPFAFTVDTMTSESAIADFGAVTTGTDGKSYLNAANFNGGTIFLTGQMEPGDIATVSVNINGSPSFVPATGTVQGTWQATLTGLVDGESVSVVATASDVAGNTASSAPLTFTVDTTTSESAIADSAVTIGRDGKSYINGANFNGGVTTLTGTAEAGDTVSVSVNGGTAEAATMAAGGAWSLTLNGLTDGTAYSAVATATDPAGNTASSDPFAFTVDADTGEQAALGLTVNGGQPIGSAVDANAVPFTVGGLDTDDNGTVTFTDGTTTATAQIVNGVAAPTVNLSGLADGTITASLTATDAAGNTFTATSSNTATLDQDKGETATLSFDVSKAHGLNIQTADANAVPFTVGGLDTDDNGTVTFTDGTTTATAQIVNGVAAPTVNLSGLADGTIIASLTATDAAGNTFTATSSNTATLDQDKGETATLSFDVSKAHGLNIQTADANAVPFTVGGLDTDDNGTVTFTDGTTTATAQIVNGVAAPTVNLSGLADGTITASLTATDAAGNTFTATSSNTATLDQDKGETATLSFDVSKAHGLNIQTADANAVPFTVGGLDTDDNGTVTFTDGTTTATAQIVNGVAAPTVNLSGLADGTITASLTATDAAGNTFTATSSNTATLDQDKGETATLSFDVSKAHGLNIQTADANAVPFTVGGLDTDDNGTVTFTDGTTTATAQIVNGVAAPTVNLSGLADGTITASLTATDAAGNTFTATSSNTATLDQDKGETATLSFDVSKAHGLNIQTADANAVPFTVGGLDTDDNGTVTFTDGTTTATAQIVNGVAAPTVNLSGLADGTITASLTATDAAGNTFTATSSNTATLDQDKGEQAALKLTVNTTAISAATAVAVPFTIGGLDAEDTGTVTFTDVNNKTVPVSVTGGKTSYTADLSSLADGTIKTSLAVNPDPAGNTFTKIAGTTVALSQFDHWTNSSGGSWSTASNWNKGLPSATIDADIDAGGTYSVNESSFATAYGLLVNDAGATIIDVAGASLTLAGTGGSASPNGVLNVTAGTFNLNGGTLKAGSIAIASGGSFIATGSSSYTGANALSEAVTDNGSFAIANSIAATIQGALSGTGSVIVENSATATFTGAITGSEQFLIENSSTATFTGAITGSERFLVENSAKAIITTSVSGTGAFTLMNSANLEFGAAVSENVTFASGAIGTLKLDKSVTSPYTGTVSGLTQNNVVDLADLTYAAGKMKATFSENTAGTGGTLTVTNGTNSVQLKLAGNYTTSTWNLSKDGSGGTKVVDPPMSEPIASNSGGRNTIPDFSFDGSSALGFSAIGWSGSGGTTPQIEPPSATLALLTQYDASGFVSSGVGHGLAANADPSQLVQETWLTKPHA